MESVGNIGGSGHSKYCFFNNGYKNISYAQAIDTYSNYLYLITRQNMKSQVSMLDSTVISRLTKLLEA